MTYKNFRDGYRNQRDWTESVLEHKAVIIPSDVAPIPMRALGNDPSYVLGMEMYTTLHPINDLRATIIAGSALMGLESAPAEHHPALADAAFHISPMRVRMALRETMGPQLEARLSKTCPDKI